MTWIAGRFKAASSALIFKLYHYPLFARLARSIREAYIHRLAMGCCRKRRLRSNP
jgi:hypothetical protein